MKTGRILLAIVLVQAAFLAGWAGYHERLQRTEPTVRLKVLPVDPRDPLRGDYMILRFAVSEHRGSETAGPPYGEVWVGLREQDGLHAIDRIVSTEVRPDDEDALTWVRAHARQDYAPPGTPPVTELIYGIERLFVPEGRGTPRFDRMEIEAAVGPSGRLFIKRAWLDGEVFP